MPPSSLTVREGSSEVESVDELSKGGTVIFRPNSAPKVGRRRRRRGTQRRLKEDERIVFV